MTIRYGYALNQWDTNIDDFVRHRDHERAFKTIAISGFSGIELTASSFGPWEPFGSPTQIDVHYGSTSGLKKSLESCGIEAISSWVYDPAIGFETEMGVGFDPRDPESRQGIAATAGWFAQGLAELGGSVLVVRPVGSAWITGVLSDDDVQNLADTWNEVGRRTSAFGVRTALRFDFLSALRLGGGLERLVNDTDPELVGIALNTAEMAIAGLDPVEFYGRNSNRVWHVQYTNAKNMVDERESLLSNADQNVRIAGGDREIPRWYFEPSDEGGLVDFEGMSRALAEAQYDGWVIFESPQSPHPAESTMTSGWFLQHVIEPLLSPRPKIN